MKNFKNIIDIVTNVVFGTGLLALTVLLVCKVWVDYELVDKAIYTTLIFMASSFIIWWLIVPEENLKKKNKKNMKWTCRKKRRFRGIIQAKEFIERFNKNAKKKLTLPYFCVQCECYHVTSMPKSKIRKLRF